jgi:hypothetical protein
VSTGKQSNQQKKKKQNKKQKKAGGTNGTRTGGWIFNDTLNDTELPFLS